MFPPDELKPLSDVGSISVTSSLASDLGWAVPVLGSVDRRMPSTTAIRR